MNIAFLTSDDMWVDRFIQLNRLERKSVTIHKEIQTIMTKLEQQGLDAVVVSDLQISCESLYEFTDIIHGISRQPQKILVLSNQSDQASYEALLKEGLTGGWTIIRALTSKDSIMDELSRMILGQTINTSSQSNRMIQFLGSTPNIGATVAAFGTAAHMAGLTKSSIAYICLNLKSSKIHRYIGVDEPVHTLDNIRAELKSLSLTSEKLQQYAYKIKLWPNLHILFGNMPREQAELYTMEDINYLLDKASQTFDYCIVDTSAYWDNAATISTTLKAGIRLLVTTGQLGHFQEDVNRWLQPLAPVFGCSANSFDLLITQRDEGLMANNYSFKEIRKETGMRSMGHIRKCKNIDTMLNQGRLWDAVNNPGSLGEDSSTLATTLLTLLGDKQLLNKETKTWLQSFVSSVIPQGRRISYDRK